jgi:hypothetical protein
MATPPVKNTAPRASSILSQETTASTATAKPLPAGAPLSITTKAWVTLRRVFFTAADVADSAKLYDILNRMQEATLQILGVVSTNQLVPGNILRSIKFTSGVAQMVVHGLGRPWQGYFIVRASVAGLLSDATYSAGSTSDSVVPLVSAADGTFDIYVF